MYFCNSEHRGNYEYLLSTVYSSHNTEYVSNIYLASFPDIFQKIDITKLDKNESPLWQLAQLKETDSNDLILVVDERLSSAIKSLVLVGISMFSEIDINFGKSLSLIQTPEWKKVLLEAISIHMTLV